MWFKVDDGFHSSRKLLSIPKRHRLAAAGLWVIAGSWCGQNLTGGNVPDYMLKEWGATPAVVTALVESGLWEPIDDANVFYKWHEYQPSKQDVDAERAASRERMRDLRARRKQTKPQESAPKDEPFGRTGANGSENVCNPDPTRPDPIPKGIEEEASQAPPAKKKRGQRIPDGWMPDGDLITTMTQECPHVDQQLEHRKFVDYWASQPGAKGVKLDWNATYRNWIRRASENAPRTGNRSTDRMRAGYEAMSGPAPRLDHDPFAPKEITS